MSLVSYADLSAPSPSDPTKTTAQAALDRMLNAKNPMPPSPLSIAPAEIQTFQTWVNAGMPTADCSTPITPPPPSIFDTPHQCSTGTPAAPNNNGSATMRPGVACISCHTQSGEGEVPKGLGGTVFKTAHEPNDCSGRSTSSAGNALTVQIIDAAGTVVQSLAVNRIGNFYSDTPPPNPFTAKVIDNVTQLAREMVKPQKSGDCNACHTENGTTTVIGGQSAPGRIMAP
jgi:mono/diheme cytochrome c family protein